MNLLVINGPNINMLGIREIDVYGHGTYADLTAYINDICDELNISVSIFQSNYEGEIITEIQNAYGRFDGIVINPAAYTHTSIAILDALKAINLPTVEVHLTDIYARESFRHISYVSMACEKSFYGLGFEGYKQAILYLSNREN